MIPEDRYEDYKSILLRAKELAAVHDCKYYVYDMPESVGYQCTPWPDPDRKLLGEAYPSGRVLAHALFPGTHGGVRL